MREFIYYSRTAPTSGNYIKEDLQESGRIDIAIHTVIATFFLSHKIRPDARLHLCFAGPPDPPKHLELKPVVEGETGIEAKAIAKGEIKRKCPTCKEGDIVLRSSIYGKFYGCSNYPKCRYTEKLANSNKESAEASG